MPQRNRSTRSVSESTSEPSTNGHGPSNRQDRGPQIVLKGEVTFKGNVRAVGARGVSVADIAIQTKDPAGEPGKKFEVTVWGDLADETTRLQKGDNIKVMGRAKPERDFERGDGTTGHVDNEVTADFIGVKTSDRDWTPLASFDRAALEAAEAAKSLDVSNGSVADVSMSVGD